MGAVEGICVSFGTKDIFDDIGIIDGASVVMLRAGSIGSEVVVVASVGTVVGSGVGRKVGVSVAVISASNGACV